LKRLPFNACDYRCERCLETAACAVFQKLQEKSLLHRLRGVDEDDPAAIFQDVADILDETQQMIQKEADEFGIDLGDIPEEVSAAMDREFWESENDPLYKRSHDFTMQTHTFLKNIDSMVTGEARDYFDDILWHHTVVTAKIFRALGPDDDDEALREDVRNSAAVAVKSLTICIMSFEFLASRYPAIAAECKGLSAIAETIKKDVRARFARGN
jgi:hypothetical protein